MKVTATLWGTRPLEGWGKGEEWREALAYLFAVSPKVGEGGSAWTKGSTAKKLHRVLDLAEAAGCQRHGWVYSRASTLGKAEREGRAIAKAARVYRLTRIYWNAEYHWLTRAGGGEATGLEVVRVLRAEGYEGEIVFNGIHYSKYFGRPAVTSRLMAQFDGWSPMIYTAHRTAAKLDKAIKRLDRWHSRGRAAVSMLAGATSEFVMRAHRGEPLDHEGYRRLIETSRLAEQPIIAMVSSGRTTTKSGRPTLKAHHLIEHVVRAPPAEIAVWLGSGSRGMLTQGSAGVPGGWIKLIPELGQAERMAA